MYGWHKAIPIWILALLAGFGFRFFTSEPTELLFLSVGQGDCSVFRHQGATILVDAGPPESGERIVCSRLRREGVGSVDLVFLTHPDADHVGGAAAVLRHYPSAKVAISNEFRKHSEMLQLLRKWNMSPEQVLWLPRHSRFTVGEFELNVYAPILSVNEIDNEGSLFIDLQSKAQSVVFTGDANSLTEASMMHLRDWRAEILHLGHHGSRNSSNPQWLSTVRPRYGIISCGKGNSYGHPHGLTLDRLQQAGIQPLRTDQLGDLRFTFQEGKFVLQTPVQQTAVK